MKILACALLLSVCGLGQAQTYSYSTFDPPGSTSTQVNGMNNAGQIVGSYRDATGATHNFLRSADGATYITIEAPGSKPATTTTNDRPGSGPRHIAFHPNGRWVYSINELDSTIDRFLWTTTSSRTEPQGLLVIAGQPVKTIAPGFPVAKNTAAEAALRSE